jgi:hypothetical protein
MDLARGVGGIPLQKRAGRQFFSRAVMGARGGLLDYERGTLPFVCVKEGSPLPLIILERVCIETEESGIHETGVIPPRLRAPRGARRGKLHFLSFPVIARRGGVPLGAAGGIVRVY